MHGLLEGRSSTGITLRAFRLNSVMNHVMFTGRRGRVYDKIAVLSGVRPGDSVLDIGSSSGYLTGRLAAVAGPSGLVTGVDPSEPAIAHARRHASPGMTFTVGVAQNLRILGPGSGHVVALLLAPLAHLVVEARYGDAPIVVVQRGEDLAERLKRIEHDAAEAAGVKIASGSLHFELESHITALRITDGGLVRA